MLESFEMDYENLRKSPNFKRFATSPILLTGLASELVISVQYIVFLELL